MTHELIEMNGQGDTRLTWDDDNADEVAAARKVFDDLIGKRFLAYKVVGKGDKGEQITRFDPSAEAIILSPPFKGG